METTYRINKQFKWNGQITEKSASVMRMFGLSVDKLENNGRVHRCDVRIKPGDIIYITGSSGAGKSVIFNQLYQQFDSDGKINLDEISLADDKTLIDCISGDYVQSLRWLSCAGISDAFSVLNFPNQLSDGQKYRFRLAMAIASGTQAIFADEFCSNLDRLTAAAVAYKVAQFARKHNRTLVLASSHDDIISELMPDAIIVKYLGTDPQVVYKD